MQTHAHLHSGLSVGGCIHIPVYMFLCNHLKY